MASSYVNKVAVSVTLGARKIESSFEFDAGECMGIWGPSGSGKTTILRVIAGLTRAQNSQIQISGQIWEDSVHKVHLPAWRRTVGVVFQEPSLLPHFSVQDNLTYAVKRSAQSTKASQALEKSIVNLLDLGQLLKRNVHQLSGGESQRVAIARALLTHPTILLLDEPLSAVDETKRKEFLPWLQRIREEFKISMIYVTHSQDEVMRLCDKVTILDKGLTKYSGALAELLAESSNHSLLSEEAAGVWLECNVVDIDSNWNLVKLGFKGGHLWIKDLNYSTGQKLRLRIKASDVSVATAKPTQNSIQNVLSATVESIAVSAHPSEALLTCQCSGTRVLAKVTSRAVYQLGLRVGSEVWLLVKSVALVK
jgi:molybdate transport system ATP-binding protein